MLLKETSGVVSAITFSTRPPKEEKKVTRARDDDKKCTSSCERERNREVEGKCGDLGGSGSMQ